jgi:shikimate kinase
MNQTQSIEELYNQRLPLYKKFADLIIQLPAPFNVNKGENLIDNRLRNL